MTSKKTDDPTDIRDDDDKEGEGGSGGGGFIPSFGELIAVTPEETEIAENADKALFDVRVNLKAQGHKVAALDRKQDLTVKQGFGPQQEAGGSNLEEHPELPDMAGITDDIAFPASEADLAASNDPNLALRNELKNRLGMGLSMQTLKEELKNKEKYRARPNMAPDVPRERPKGPPPKPRPF